MSIINTTNPTNFMLHIPDNGLTEAIQMNVQIYKPPIIEISGVDIPSGPFGKSRSHVPATTFKYKPISLSILVDKELKTWLEMYQWALAIVNYPEYYNREVEKTSDTSIYMHILDNKKENTVVIHEFTYPFPSLIYPPTYNHTASTDYPMIMNVEMKYHTFFVRDSQGNRLSYRKTVDQARQEEYNSLKDEYFQKDKPFEDIIDNKFEC